MDTSELIKAAASIAGALAARSFDAGDRSPGRYQDIAKAAVAIAREIEAEVRRGPSPSSSTGSRPPI
jgi:hypothetical protein